MRDAKSFKREPAPEVKGDTEDSSINEIKKGGFVGTMNLNDYDLSETATRNWIYRNVKENNVNLVMFNAPILQAKLKNKARSWSSREKFTCVQPN